MYDMQSLHSWNLFYFRLSASMNREMSRDETDLENINIRNRPMKIIEEFEMFCSQQCLDAKTAIDRSAERSRSSRPIPESKRCSLLCGVLSVSIVFYILISDFFSFLAVHMAIDWRIHVDTNDECAAITSAICFCFVFLKEIKILSNLKSSELTVYKRLVKNSKNVFVAFIVITTLFVFELGYLWYERTTFEIKNEKICRNRVSQQTLSMKHGIPIWN